jgi:hypothetical protein
VYWHDIFTSSRRSLEIFCLQSAAEKNDDNSSNRQKLRVKSLHYGKVIKKCVVKSTPQADHPLFPFRWLGLTPTVNYSPVDTGSHRCRRSIAADGQ